MDIRTIVKDNKLFTILNKYSEDQKMGYVLNTIIKNISSKEIIIPVLGMQGMGKSTLINSILSENILPNDADETTCVPVEVKYGQVEKAVVYFKDSSKNVEAYTREGLNEYVDNICNPGNEKKVSHIVLYRKNDLLKNGATIVDLPGVGSLTKENQDTTMRYIKNLCAAIFVIPTTPTIRCSEEMFIKGVWMQFASAIFVQNNFGETKREVKESVNFNTKVLKNIAKSINTPFNDDIIVVNAYDAITGRLKEDTELVESSNINALINKISNTVSNWHENETSVLKSKVALMLATCKREIDNIIKESNLTAEELKKACDLEEENFKINTKKLEAQVEEIIEFLEEKEDEVESFAKTESKKCVENIRREIFRVIDSGVVDGEMLTEAFTNYQEQYFSDVMSAYYDLSQNIIFEISELMEELSKTVKFENSVSIAALNFNNGQALKFEKGLAMGFDLAGAVIGIKVGVSLGSAGGPLGIAIGALAGAAVGIVANLAGKGTKNAITAKRAAEAKRQIEPTIDNVGKLIKTEFTKAFSELSEQFNESLEEYISLRKKAFKELKAKNIEKCQETFSLKYNLDELKADYNYLDEKESILSE
ncbi:dynamin family protein [Haloimpatiens sp. FM7315]|uniref:dynamin family protein n=1 Tax=Haloimpatiens sp. FM7315 TaxID=3298609 RepID=UPI0035A2A202